LSSIMWESVDLLWC